MNQDESIGIAQRVEYVKYMIAYVFSSYGWYIVLMMILYYNFAPTVRAKYYYYKSQYIKQSKQYKERERLLNIEKERIRRVQQEQLQKSIETKPLKTNSDQPRSEEKGLKL